MLTMLLQAVGLLVGTFLLFGYVGWLLGARPQKRSQSFRSEIEVETPELSVAEVVPFKQAAAPASSPVVFDTGLKMAASNLNIDPTLRGLQRQASTLAFMTPESVEAAVIQAGNGLEPIRLEAPQGASDDLKIISGVGAINEKELNELGIYHYWQIANWTPENVAWISSRIRFPKRIVRENWMSQAARLARR